MTSEHIHLCPHDPMQLAGMPIGMYHCPECGEMIVAGIPHPQYRTFGCRECDSILFNNETSGWAL